MIPINNLQAKIYQALKGVGVKVYDEVQEGATPFKAWYILACKLFIGIINTPTI